MNTQHTCGHDVRRANAIALKLELGLTLGGKIASSVCFASITGLDGPILEAAARRIGEERQDCVIAVYTDDEAVIPEFCLLLLQHYFKVLLRMGVPFALVAAKPSTRRPVSASECQELSDHVELDCLLLLIAKLGWLGA